MHTIAVTVILLAACGSSESTSTAAIVMRDSAGVVIVENDLARLSARCTISTTPSVTIGVEEGADEYQLFRVFGAGRLGDGRIAVVNQGSQQLRIYDQQGRFISQTGRQGDGPGEFRDAFYLWILPGDTIWVGDYRPWRYLVFAPEGTWVRTVQPDPIYFNPPAQMAVLDDGSMVLADRSLNPQPGTQFQPTHLTVVVHASDGTLLDTIGTYPNGRWGRMENDPQAMRLYPLFESFARVTGTGTRVVVAHMSRPEYHVLTVDGFGVTRVVRWSTGDRAIAPADIEAERERIARPYGDMNPGARRRLLEPLLSEDRPVADAFPAFVTLKAGRDGRIWIREYPRPTVPEPHEWLVFDSEGRFQCRATLPAFDEVLELGFDYLLVEDRDELGVERVLQYSLNSPSDGDD